VPDGFSPFSAKPTSNRTITMEIFFVDRPLDGFCAVEVTEPQ
jgi:hypothetical protein